MRACVCAYACVRALACLHACVLRTRMYACVTSIPHTGLPKFASAAQNFFTEGLALGAQGTWPHVRRPGQQCLCHLSGDRPMVPLRDASRALAIGRTLLAYKVAID